MLQEIQNVVAVAESIARDRGLLPALKQLRRLSLPDFGSVMLRMPHADFPALSGLLPRMASAEVQQNWTGAVGQPLLHDSVTFARILWFRYQEFTNKTLRNAELLDFGCGYGRLLRLMYFVSDPENISGVDPYEASIQICQQDGILGHIALSDYLPTELPVGNKKFDLIYSYSVFTHLSQRATGAALEVLRKYIKDDGILAITVRPVEFWDGAGSDPSTIEQMRAAHRAEGFAFVPHGRAPVDGDITYGDTSIDPKWIGDRFPEWTFLGYDRGLDVTQTILFYSPR